MKIRGNHFLRILDRITGPGILLFLRILPLARRRHHVRKRILVITNAALGDAVLYSGALREAIRLRQDADWYIAAGDLVHEVLSLAGLACNRVPLDFGHLPQTIRALREIRADTAIDVGQWSRTSAILTRLCGAKQRIGFSRKRQGRAAGFSETVSHRPDCHELDNFLALFSRVLPAGAAPISRENALPRMPLVPGPPALPMQIADLAAKPARQPHVVLHCFPGGKRAWMKELSEEQCSGLVAGLASRGYTVFLTGSRNDHVRAETLLARTLFTKNMPVNACGLTLSETASLLASAKAVISVNTGIMHLAAACGSPLVAIHGPTNPMRWGPTGNPEAIRIITPHSACQACLDLGGEYRCRTRLPACMQSITPGDILVAVDSLLAKNR